MIRRGVGNLFGLRGKNLFGSGGQVADPPPLCPPARPNDPPADVCLILEGTYPYVTGGVATWVHDLIRAHSDLTFSIVCIRALDDGAPSRYELPDNVIALNPLYLHGMPQGTRRKPRDRLFLRRLGAHLEAFCCGGGLPALHGMNTLLAAHRTPDGDSRLGQALLMNSPDAWQVITDMYERAMPWSSFIDFFWTWRILAGCVLSVLLAPLPRARVYHAVSTGYAGILAARAHMETGRPSVLTEHGIYANERRIEVAVADWLFEGERRAFSIDQAQHDLRRMWMQSFASMSHATYATAEEIITLYGGNQVLQRQDGAPEHRLRVIPNGIDLRRFGSLQKTGLPGAGHVPTVAFIGRVVPIKDVKTFLRACATVRETLPEIRVLIMGPDDEDPDYARECREMTTALGLDDCLEYTGRVRVDDYLPQIDVSVLTSISEAQPLIILECGAAAIPVVATDVGACREMILGAPEESPSFGAGGAITALANPAATAAALVPLLSDAVLRQDQGRNLQARVRALYDKTTIDGIYNALYHRMIALPDQPFDLDRTVDHAPVPRRDTSVPSTPAEPPTPATPEQEV